MRSKKSKKSFGNKSRKSYKRIKIQKSKSISKKTKKKLNKLARNKSKIFKKRTKKNRKKYKKLKSKNKQKGGNFKCSDKIVSNKLNDLCIYDSNGKYTTYEECASSVECLTKWNKDEYIRLLKEKKLHEKWEKSGSFFGIIKHPPVATVVIYKDMFDNDVGVNLVGREFENINKGVSFPVFDFVRSGNMNDLPHYLSNGIPIRLNVKQGHFLIVPKTESLTTAGLATCSGLAMIIGTKKFLTHLDAHTNTTPIINAIQKTLSEENITSANINDIKVWQGRMPGRDYALNKVDDILRGIGIDPDSSFIFRENVCYMDEKYI